MEKYFLTTMTTTKAFISSIMDEMGKERDRVEKSVDSLSMQANRFEIFPAHPSSAWQLSIEEVEDSEIFIQILGKEISDITIKEYKTAQECMSDRILIFVKDVEDRSPEMKKHLKEIRKHHTYKNFSNLDALEDQVKYAVQSLVTFSLRSKKQMKISKIEEILVKETIALSTGKREIFKFEVRDGDRIKGLIEGTNNFDVYIFNEEEYVDWRNGEYFEPDGDEIKAYRVDERVLDDDIWYLIIYTGVLFGPVTIDVKLTRVKTHN